MKKLSILVLITAILWVIWVQQAMAVTHFYVDPDWVGTENGTASNPWTSLTNLTWNSINNALAGDDVTVYFSAKNASENSDQTTIAQISIRRTDMSSHRLTLSGMDMYNSNDSTPTLSSWLPNPGDYKFHITSEGSNISSGTIREHKQNYVTIRGFKATNTRGGKCISYWAGDHIVIEHNDLTQTSAASGGPTLYFHCILNTSDGVCPDDRSGGASCFPSTDIRISNNTLHDGYGEGLYFCGCYTQTVPECAKDTGGHSNVVITDNIFWDIATRGAEGDAIEVKPSVYDLTISRNTLYSSEPTTRRGHGIIFNGGALIEDNFIYNMGQAGIEANENADDAVGFRDGVVIRNNVLVNNGNGPYSWAHGIHFNYEVGGDDWQNVEIYNNTIWGAGGNGIRIDSPDDSNFKIINNIIAACSDIELMVPSDTVTANDYNILYDDTGSVSLINGVRINWDYNALNGDTGLPENSLVGDPGLVAPASAAIEDVNYDLSESSIAKGAGMVLSGFTADYMGRERTASWDIGAFAHASEPTPQPENNGQSNGGGNSGGGCFFSLLR